jgi:membrane protein involved in colicin uptake
MFVLILVVILYVFVDFGGSYIQKTHQNQQKHTKDPPKSAKTYKRPTKISRNIQKNHQNQHKHTKDPPKSTQIYKRTTKINKNIQKNHQNQQKHTKEPPKSCMFLLILVGLLHVFVDFGGSFVCFC